MKYKQYLIPSLILILIIKFFTFGQTSYNAPLGSYVNPRTGNAVNSLLGMGYDDMLYSMQQMQQYNMQYLNAVIASQLIVQAYKQEYGQKRINAGQASTRFVSSPNKSIVDEFVASAKTLEEKQKLKTTATAALQGFNEVMRSKGLTPNDMADANALAFVLCYLVYKNEDPGSARLNKLRAFNKQDILKNIIFQGTPNEEHQKKYESRAIRTMLAVGLAGQLKNNNLSTVQKQSIQENAKRYAASVLKELWGNNIEGLELSENQYGFADKGERLVKTGAGGTTFTRLDGKSTWAEKNAYCFEKDSFRRIEGDTKCFYDMRDRFDAEIKAMNGETNDLAFAQAVTFKLLYEVYTNGKVKLNQKQFDWILNQMQQFMLKTPAWQTLSNENKQLNFDNYVFSTMRTYDNYVDSLNKLRQYQGDLGKAELRSIHAGLLDQESTNAYNKLNEIFAPLHWQDYKLNEDGFVKIR